jgi:hypothetical protein
MTNNDSKPTTTPTYQDWEEARQKRNDAAMRVVWRTYGTERGGTGHPEDPDVAKYLAEFYTWDEEMDRISEALDEAKAAGGAE